MAFTGMVNWKSDKTPQLKPQKKVCTKCKAEKDLEEFYRKRQSIDGKCERCKECDDARMREYKARKKAEKDLYGFI